MNIRGTFAEQRTTQSLLYILLKKLRAIGLEATPLLKPSHKDISPALISLGKKNRLIPVHNGFMIPIMQNKHSEVWTFILIKNPVFPDQKKAFLEFAPPLIKQIEDQLNEVDKEDSDWPFFNSKSKALKPKAFFHYSGGDLNERDAHKWALQLHERSRSSKHFFTWSFDVWNLKELSNLSQVSFFIPLIENLSQRDISLLKLLSRLPQNQEKKTILFFMSSKLSLEKLEALYADDPEWMLMVLKCKVTPQSNVIRLPFSYSH